MVIAALPFSISKRPAWHASQDASATGEWTEALSSFAVAAECGSWQPVQEATGYFACAFWKPSDGPEGSPPPGSGLRIG